MTSSIGPWTYEWHEAPRPFVHPVRTPAGHRLSVDAPLDHPWQHALWFTIKFVNGQNFWEEYDEFGTLRQSAPPTTITLDDGRVVAINTIQWVRPDGESVVATERLTLVHRPLPELGAVGLDWDVRFTPATDVELDRTPFTTWGGYGGLTLRGRPDWHDTVLRLPDGVARDQILGERAAWCALDGPLTDPDGEHDIGVMMLDHPDNPGHPVPWYASTRQATYALEGWTNFLNAAFLWDGPVELAAGEELRLRYRFLTHDGLWDLPELEAAWLAWQDDCDNERLDPKG